MLEPSLKTIEISSPLPDAAHKGSVSKCTHEEEHQSQEQPSIVYNSDSGELPLMTNSESATNQMSACNPKPVG